MVEIDLKGLRKNLTKINLLDASYQQCIDWAVSELLRGVEDLNVCLLASSNVNDKHEMDSYIRNILGDNFIISEVELQETAGELIINFGDKYFSNKITIIDIESIIYKLYLSLENNDWLVILSRNAEYATDIDYFKKPFENELKYIIELWSQYTIYTDFINNYHRRISNMNME
jgi:hypothetical protein